jgi:hypothetical protein
MPYDQVAIRGKIQDAVNRIVKTPNHVDYVALCDFDSPIEKFIVLASTVSAGSIGNSARDVDDKLVRTIVVHEVTGYQKNPFHGYKHAVNDNNTVGYVPINYKGYFLVYISSEGAVGKTPEQKETFEGEFEDAVGETARDLIPAIRAYYKSMNGGSTDNREKEMLDLLMRG